MAKIAGNSETEVDALKRAHAEPLLDKIDGYWYLATVYTKHPDGISAAFAGACEAVATLWRERGVKTFSPIAHTHPVAIHGGIDPLDHTIWMPLDEPMMRAAHGLLVVEMPGHEHSKGIAAEVEAFRSMNKPIHRLTWPELNIRHG